MSATMLSKVRSYLAERCAHGLELTVQRSHLMNFARYADRQGCQGKLKSQVAIRWACLPKNGERVYWAQRLAIIRTFAKRLLLTDPKTQVPPRYVFGPASRRNPPHLYTAGQIEHLLNRAAQLPGRFQAQTFEVLIGMLACTGLRISEALRLRISDVDLNKAVMIVRESKRRTRLVPLHRTAIGPLHDYAQRRQKLFPRSNHLNHFFVSERGTALAYSTVAHKFLELRQGIQFARRAPRLHDLRHTFACRVLQRWQSTKRGAAQRIAVLSRVLGHVHVADTYWYFSTFPELLADATRHLERTW